MVRNGSGLVCVMLSLALAGGCDPAAFPSDGDSGPSPSADGGASEDTLRTGVGTLTPCDPIDLGSRTGPAVWTGENVGPSTTQGSCGGMGPELALQFAAPSEGTYTIDTRGSAIDTVLYVRRATCDGAELACEDDETATVTTSSVSVAMSAGEVVIVVVDGYASSSSGRLVVNIASGSAACIDGEVRACSASTGACRPGTQTCVAGVLGPCEGAIGPTTEVCNGLDDDCDGRNDDGVATCSAGPNVSSSVCSAGVCSIACDPRFGDCDGDPSNGCETSTVLDDRHCGGCGVVCGAGMGCRNGSCTVLPALVSERTTPGLSFAGAVGTSDGAYLVGSLTGTVDLGGATFVARGAFDLAIVSLDLEGNVRWARAYGDTGDETGRRIALDASNNLIVVGACRGTCSAGGSTFAAPTGDTSGFVASFSPLGVPRWSTPVGDPGADTLGAAIAIAPSGRVRVALNMSASRTLGPHADIATFEPTGVLVRRDNFNLAFREISALVYEGTDLWIGGSYAGLLAIGGSGSPARGVDVGVVRMTEVGAQTFFVGGSAGDDRLGAMLVVSGEAILLASLAGDAPFVSDLAFGGQRVTMARLRPTLVGRVWTIDWSGETSAAALAHDGARIFVRHDETGMLGADGTGYMRMSRPAVPVAASAMAVGGSSRLFVAENETVVVYRYR